MLLTTKQRIKILATGFKDDDGTFHPTGDSNGIRESDVKSKSTEAESIINKNKAQGLKSLKELKANASEHGLTDGTLLKLQELEGDDVFVEGVEDNAGFAEKAKLIKLDNGSEYLLFESRDDLDNEAKAIVRNDLEEDPSMFESGFIADHQTINDTNAHLLAIDFAESRLEGVEDDVANDIDTEVRDEFSAKEDEDDFEDFVSNEVQKRLPDQLDKKRTEIVDQITEEIKSDFKDFIVNQEGLVNEEDFQKEYAEKWMFLDIDSAVDDAVSIDGAEHFVSREDGESHEIDDKLLVKGT